MDRVCIHPNQGGTLERSYKMPENMIMGATKAGRMVRPMKGLAEKEDTYWPIEVAAQLPEMKVNEKTKNCLMLGSMPVWVREINKLHNKTSL